MIGLQIDLFDTKWIRTEKKIHTKGTLSEGDLFQQICGDILSERSYQKDVNLSFRLSSFKTLGKDGGIDHFGYTDTNHTLIVECKKNETVELCFQSIKALRNSLIVGLEPPTAKYNRYAPWFNNHLKTYIFCTSCFTTDARQHLQIRDSLKGMMMELSNLKPDLSHLSEIEIKVHTWNDLKLDLVRSPFLLFSWVDYLFEGLEPVINKTSYRNNYQSYLSSNVVQYRSRDSFNKKYLEVQDLPSEKFYLQELIGHNGDKYDVLIIHGQGGVGKTRLMRELALMAQKNRWQAYSVKPTIDFYKLVGELQPGGKYLFLFDYLQEFQQYGQWIDTLTKKRINCQVKVICNCRNGYRDYLNFPSGCRTIEMDISFNSASAKLYYNYVISLITRPISSFKNIDKKFFRNRLSFAVFVRFIYDRDKKNKLLPGTSKTFQEWIINRLEQSFVQVSDKKQVRELLTKLLICLPSHGKGKRYIERSYFHELSILMNDGWVEERIEIGNTDEKHLVVTHDSIADELLLKYLKSYKNSLDAAINNLFHFAGKNHLIFGCSNTFDRVGARSLYPNYDFVSTFSELIDDYPEQMKESYYHLVKTKLINENSMVGLYTNHLSFFKPYIISKEFAGPLSFLLNDLSRKSLPKSLREQVGRLYEIWLDHNREILFNNLYVAKIVSSSIRFFGIAEREMALLEGYLAKAINDPDTSYVIAAWLDKKGELSKIESPLIIWLNKFETYYQSKFVMMSWLSAGGDWNILRHPAKKWLELYGDNLDAQQMILSWLNHNGGKLILRKYLVAWVVAYPTEKEAKFMLNAWIDVRGKLRLVRKAMEAWLDNNPLTLDCGVFLNKWLNNGGDLEVILPYIDQWLDVNNLKIDCGSFFEAWLKVGGSPIVIEDKLLTWLELHAESLDACFVLEEWAKVDKHNLLINPYMLRWLSFKENDSKLEASFILGIWMERKNDKAKIEKHLSNWFSKNSKSIEASYVIGAWLDTNGKLEVVREYVENWPKKNYLQLKASFIIGSWLKAGGDKRVMEKHMLTWLKKFRHSLPASFVIDKWLRAKGDRFVVEKQLFEWLELNDTHLDASFVIEAWIEADERLVQISKHMFNWLDLHQIDFTASHVLQPWLKYHGEPSRIEEYYLNWFKLQELRPNLYYTLNRWLEAGGNPLVIKKYVREYLEKYSKSVNGKKLQETWFKLNMGLIK